MPQQRIQFKHTWKLINNKKHWSCVKMTKSKLKLQIQLLAQLQPYLQYQVGGFSYALLTSEVIFVTIFGMAGMNLGIGVSAATRGASKFRAGNNVITLQSVSSSSFTLESETSAIYQLHKILCLCLTYTDFFLYYSTLLEVKAANIINSVTKYIIRSIIVGQFLYSVSNLMLDMILYQQYKYTPIIFNM
ncbi:Hypothetical_protein [Hexamita inflata]|uniref:Hypothetical_protein n=1 Tax=Hexamita inflata TaxID=28002 RepID=A0AA86U7I2_9EUKA|nr:Hypothetical protein HINF_LOCUS31799 [Hexamita inflata]